MRDCVCTLSVYHFGWCADVADQKFMKGSGVIVGIVAAIPFAFRWRSRRIVCGDEETCRLLNSSGTIQRSSSLGNQIRFKDDGLHVEPFPYDHPNAWAGIWKSTFNQTVSSSIVTEVAMPNLRFWRRVSAVQCYSDARMRRCCSWWRECSRNSSNYVDDRQQAVMQVL